MNTMPLSGKTGNAKFGMASIGCFIGVWLAVFFFETTAQDDSLLQLALSIDPCWQ